MSPAPLHGRSESFGATPDDLREAIMGKLGDTNMQRNGITFGKVAGGNEPHALDSEYVSFAPSVAGGNVYTLRHGRGKVPGFVKDWHQENTRAPLSQYTVTPYRRDKWTTTNVQVLVTPVGAATLDGAEITVMIGGE